MRHCKGLIQDNYYLFLCTFWLMLFLRFCYDLDLTIFQPGPASLPLPPTWPAWWDTFRSTGLSCRLSFTGRGRYSISCMGTVRLIDR